MYSRVTLVEVDTVRVSMEDALTLFREQVLPRLRAEPGFAGVVVMDTREGKGLLMSLWETAEAADVTRVDGFYATTLAEHAMAFRAQPGRERYEVLLADTPALVAP